jgi:hypothetical protein
MKKFVITAILAVLFGSGSALIAQDRQEGYLGLPGDNLNLYAVMKLFQESQTLEDFERDLNDEKTNINNLDLNNDNRVDYIKVMDNIDGNVHNIVLQVAVGPKENQDVAVVTVQRFNNGEVQIQLTGDEELYGRDYIIEPRIDDSLAETPNPGYSGQSVTYYRTTPVEIAAWPIVRFVYLPSYTRWHSSWNWGYYPSYWHPWQPFSWHYYYGYHYNWHHDYYGHYRQWKYHRYSDWNDTYYRKTRSYSPEVSHRIQTGVYKTTYSKPDDRRRGEARFAETHPEVIRRSNDRSSGNSNVDRRSSTTVTNRTVVNKPDSRNNSNTTTRRSSTTVTDRSVTKPTPSNRSVTNPTPSNRSVTSPSTNRSVSSPSSNRSSNPSSNSSVSNRRSVDTKSESAPTVRSNNSNSQPRTNNATSVSRKKTETKSTTVRSSESKKKAESNSERRK